MLLNTLFLSTILSDKLACFLPPNFFLSKTLLIFGGCLRGAQKLIGEKLKVVWAEFSTLSLAVLLHSSTKGLHTYSRF
jgi:hypothetical protein